MRPWYSMRQKAAWIGKPSLVWNWHIATLLRLSSLPLPIKADILLDAAQSRSNVMGRPPRQAGSRSISRPSDRSTEPASGLGPFGLRSLRQEHGSVRFARFRNANNQDWSRCPACMLHRGSRINLYPVERQRLVPKSCILVAARLQDGWDSSLVRLIRPTRHPQSHIRPGIGPEAWAKLIQLIK